MNHKQSLKTLKSLRERWIDATENSAIEGVSKNKALSDFRCKAKFSSCFMNDYKAIWKENLAIYQKSLRAFFQATL